MINGLQYVWINYMVGAKAKNFENLRSIHCWKNAVSEILLFFQAPYLINFKMFLVHMLGECYFQGIWQILKI